MFPSLYAFYSVEEFSITISNIVIQPIKCVKCLGFLIDERLDWHEHIHSCKNKLTSALYATTFFLFQPLKQSITP